VMHSTARYVTCTHNKPSTTFLQCTTMHCRLTNRCKPLLCTAVHSGNVSEALPCMVLHCCAPSNGVHHILKRSKNAYGQRQLLRYGLLSISRMIRDTDYLQRQVQQQQFSELLGSNVASQLEVRGREWSCGTSDLRLWRDLLSTSHMIGD